MNCLPSCFIIDLYSNANESLYSLWTSGFVPLRTKIRTDRGIDGTLAGDCCSVCFCYPCAIYQMGIEVDNTDGDVHYYK